MVQAHIVARELGQRIEQFAARRVLIDSPRRGKLAGRRIRCVSGSSVTHMDCASPTCFSSAKNAKQRYQLTPRMPGHQVSHRMRS